MRVRNAEGKLRLTTEIGHAPGQDLRPRLERYFEKGGLRIEWSIQIGIWLEKLSSFPPVLLFSSAGGIYKHPWICVCQKLSTTFELNWEGNTGSQCTRITITPAFCCPEGIIRCRRKFWKSIQHDGTVIPSTWKVSPRCFVVQDRFSIAGYDRHLIPM